MLRDFVGMNRNEILARARARVSARSLSPPSDVELSQGLPVFLEQLRQALHRATEAKTVDHEEIQLSAGQHGHDLFSQGVSVAQVVHDYGDLCQVITALSVEQREPIAAAEFQTLNLCLDDAIAGAVTAYSYQRERALAAEGTERLGYLAHEMRNVINTAMLSFASIKRGVVPAGGATGAALERSHLRMQSLIDRSMADVRLEEGLQNLERVPVRELVEEVEVGASLVAQGRGLHLDVPPIDPVIIVEADRQILAAALANLVQNALKFTRAGTTVSLRVSTTTDRVLIDVEDECGGLPPVQVKNLLRPFFQTGADRTGLGLGLSICLKAVKAIAGELHIRDLPGKGCVFTIDLPKQPPPPTFINARKRDPEGGGGHPEPSGRPARAV